MSFFLNPKNWVYLIIAAALAYGGYRTYNFIFDRGAEAQKKIDAVLIADAQKKQEAAEKELAKYKESYTNWVRDTQISHARALAEQQRILAQTQQSLADAELSLTRKESSYNALRILVNQELGDLRMPGSVVRLWNLSLEGTTPDSGELGSALAGSALGSDDTTTDVTLFDLLEAGLRNNAEGVSRGVKLQQWRRWEAKNRSVFEAHERQLEESSDALAVDRTGN